MSIINGVIMDKKKYMFEEKQKKLKEKKELLKFKEKQYMNKKFLDMGKLVHLSKISNLDDQLLLGAFLEIAERMNDETSKSVWLEKEKKFRAQDDKNVQTRILLSFKNPPPLEVRNSLRQMKFRWNEFRKEYQGIGDKAALENLLKGLQYDLEEIK
jgi:hypothetical protein